MAYSTVRLCVAAIVAMEPSGPPVHDNVEKGAPSGSKMGLCPNRTV